MRYFSGGTLSSYKEDPHGALGIFREFLGKQIDGRWIDDAFLVLFLQKYLNVSAAFMKNMMDSKKYDMTFEEFNRAAISAFSK